MSDRVGEISTGKVLAMADVFANVYSRMFDLGITNRNGDEVKGLQRPHRTLEEIHRMMNRVLRHAERQDYNVFIRPIRSTGPLPIQLDNFDQVKVE